MLVVNVILRPLYPREWTPLPFQLETVWAPEPVWWVLEERESPLPLQGFEPQTFQPTVSRCTDYITPAATKYL